jgi:hypothetical protein
VALERSQGLGRKIGAPGPLFDLELEVAGQSFERGSKRVA